MTMLCPNSRFPTVPTTLAADKPAQLTGCIPRRGGTQPGHATHVYAWRPLLGLWAVMVAMAALATDADPYAERMRTLGEELRCLVCQNQTLADSQSGLADDMRREMRSMMAKGMTDREVVDFLVQRYGDFVRYLPPVKATTAFLWYSPGLAMLAGLWLLGRRIARRNGTHRTESELSAEERAQLQTLMTGKPGGTPT
jgi:cytochrome c-type biogenesis protein CcmH